MAMKKYTSVQEYFDDHSGMHLEIMKKIRDLILEESPEAKPSISYGMPAFKTDKVIAGFYAYKKHVSFYPHSSEVLEKFSDQLKDYKFSKGTLQIGLQQEFPEMVIRNMIREKMRINND